MFDLMVLAFQTDATRICTFMYANEGSNRPYPFIGVPEGHHDLSHHGSDPKKHEKIKKINRFHVEQFAYLLGKLKSIREGDGTLLDNAMIVYGSGISDGNRHNHDDLPILLAGKGGGTIKPAGTSSTPPSRSTTSICRCSTAWASRSTDMGTARDGWKSLTGDPLESRLQPFLSA